MSGKSNHHMKLVAMHEITQQLGAYFYFIQKVLPRNLQQRQLIAAPQRGFTKIIATSTNISVPTEGSIIHTSESLPDIAVFFNTFGSCCPFDGGERLGHLFHFRHLAIVWFESELGSWFFSSVSLAEVAHLFCSLVNPPSRS